MIAGAATIHSIQALFTYRHLCDVVCGALMVVQMGQMACGVRQVRQPSHLLLSRLSLCLSLVTALATEHGMSLIALSEGSKAFLFTRYRFRY